MTNRHLDSGVRSELVRYQIVVLPLAGEDVARIRDYIAASNPLNAARYALKLVESFEALGILPRSWPRVTTRKFGEVRHRVVGPHRVLFRVNDSAMTVTILRVVHAHQSMRRVFTSLPRHEI